MESIFWKGYSKEERHATINLLQTIISKYGNVVDFHLFSDVSLSMTIDIESNKIEALYEALNQCIEIEKNEYSNSHSPKEVNVFLNISFAKSTGNLKVEVPMVPG
jgi:hypothetical protein